MRHESRIWIYRQNWRNSKQKRRNARHFEEIKTWFEAAAGREPGSAYVGALMEKLGFEKAYEEQRDYSKVPFYFQHKTPDKDSSVHVYARPGVVAAYDTYHDSVNSLYWEMNWIPRQGVDSFLRDQAHEEFLHLNSRLMNVEMSQMQQKFFHASRNRLKSTWQLIHALNYLQQHGDFQVPFLRFNQSLLSFQGDYYQQAEISKLDSLPRTAPTDVKDAVDNAVAHMVKLASEIRALKLPLWVRQMTGQAPIPAVEPQITGEIPSPDTPDLG